jgi:hypothetical protein
VPLQGRLRARQVGARHVRVRRDTDLAHSQSLVDDMVVTCFKSNDIKKFTMEMKNLF